MMRNRMCMWKSALVALACVLAPSAGWAQEPAAAPADPSSTQGTAPTATGVAAPSAEVATPEPVAVATTAAPTDVAPSDAKTAIPGWFRVDADSAGIAIWAGARHAIGPVDIASDVYLTTGGYSELDIGPLFSFGPVTLLPMVGMGFDFGAQLATTLVAPQLYTYVSSGPFYFESWLQLVLNSPFAEGTQNSFYTRDFFLLYPIEEFGFGPYVELTADLNEVPGVTLDPAAPAAVDDTGLASLQIGGSVGVKYGANTSLLLYLGYETQEESQLNDKIAGRFTFIYNW